MSSSYSVDVSYVKTPEFSSAKFFSEYDPEFISSLAQEHGALADAQTNPKGITLLCELLFEVWRALGSPEPEFADDRQESHITAQVGHSAYYAQAFYWLSTVHPDVADVYTARELERPALWFDVVYLLFGGAVTPAPLFYESWASFPVPATARVSAITKYVDGAPVLDINLAPYVGKVVLSTYIRQLRSSRRYIPLGIFYSAQVVQSQGLVEPDPALNWLVGEVSRAQCVRAVQVFSQAIGGGAGD